jgi:exonuclease SbcC
MLRRLEMRGFEGYREAEIEFSPGLNLITGRNSSGKTTILEAILSALYGEVPGVQKRMLVSRLQDASRRLSVKLSLRMPEKGLVEIEREGRIQRRGEEEGFRTERIRLTIEGEEAHLEGEEDLRRRVTELTGLSMKKFINLVYVRQGELTGILEPRREDMDSILGINLMREIAEQLEELEKELEEYEERDAKTLLESYREGELPRIETYLESLKSQIEPLERESEQLENLLSRAESEELRGLLESIRARENHMERLRETEIHLNRILEDWGARNPEDLERMLDEASGRLTRLELEAKRLGAERERLRRTADNLRRRLDRAQYILSTAGASNPEELEELIAMERAWLEELKRRRGELEGRVEASERRRNELSGRISALEDEIKSHEELLVRGAAECPTCGQRITPELLAQLIEIKSDQHGEIVNELTKVEEEYHDLKKKFEDLDEELKNTSSKVNKLQELKSELNITLEGASQKDLQEALSKIDDDIEKVESIYDGKSKELAVLLDRQRNLKETVSKVLQLNYDKLELQSKIQKCADDISEYLKRLNLPLDPKDPNLKEKIAERLPLSIEEIEKRRIELDGKRKLLNMLKRNFDKYQRDRHDILNKIEIIERRLKRARLTSEMVEKLKRGIEEGRRRTLTEVAREALRIYNSLTDQRVYMSFRIDPETYEAWVQPMGLEEYIPARRVGGGHQTLIALSLRIALLNVLGHRNLLILDEPTYGVDSENLPQLISQISEASKRISQVILVTHHGFGEEEAANIIRVSRNPDGSSKVERMSLP